MTQKEAVMAAKIRQILLTTSLAATASMIATVPAFAVGLTRPSDIEFTKNGVVNTDASQLNIRSWNYDSTKPPVTDSTGIGSVNRQLLNDITKNNAAKATSALTDNSSATNVELFTDGETITDNVGFQGKLGKNKIKVESVTKADWADGKLATAWLTGFGNTYGSLMQGIATTPGSNMYNDFQNNFGSFVTYLSTNGFNAAGDANIGDITYDDTTGKLNVDLVGHYDVTGRYLDTRKTVKVGGRMVNNPLYGIGTSPDIARNRTGNPILDGVLFSLAKQAFKTGTTLQVSEIAKVTFNDKVDYAFAFAATESNAIAGDRNVINDNTSHTGVYSWTNTYPVPKPPVERKVPEPSALLALMAVGGAAFAQRKAKKETLS
ncbi:MAG: NF038130 family PEP-CTERM protein [Scytonematopsis contorta HA4267-MV1]|nr:NF038130 family PEP-CTERM protein [Scytonematopsis contorta HA4267-MV1]